jgi:predicted transcriptional regulator
MSTKKAQLQPISGAVPQPVRKRLVEIAKKDRRPLSQVVRIALEEFVERRRSAA